MQRARRKREHPRPLAVWAGMLPAVPKLTPGPRDWRVNSGDGYRTACGIRLRPTKFHLAINLKNPRALDLEMPATLLSVIKALDWNASGRSAG
jgi:hypothetical protein